MSDALVITIVTALTTVALAAIAAFGPNRHPRPVRRPPVPPAGAHN